MKTRNLLSFAVALFVLSPLLPAAPASTAITVLTTRKSNLALANGSIGLAQGSKLEVVGADGTNLVVMYHNVQGRVPASDTDFNPATPLKEIAPVAVAKPAATAAPAVSAAPTARPATATPPALSTTPNSQQPTTNYGKMVQKAKASEQAHKETLVDPTKPIQ